MNQAVKMKAKFECVLLELVKNDYKLSDDTILEKLVTHLSVKEQGSEVIDVPFCMNWVQSALLLWNKGKISVAIASFALRLMGIIFENECHFMSFTCSNSHTSQPLNLVVQLSKTLKLNPQNSSNFSMKYALVKLLLSVLSHSSGRKWIILSGIWEDVLQLSLTDASIYVIREGRLFLSRLLNELPEENEPDAESIFARVLELFVSTPLSDNVSPELVKVVPSLHIVTEILQRAFHTIDPGTNKLSSVMMKIMHKPRFTLLQKSLHMLKLADDEVLEEQSSKIAVFLYILDIIKDGECMEPKDIKAACLEILDVFNILIAKGSVQTVLNLCVLCHNHWAYVRKLNSVEEEGNDEQDGIKKYRFEDQLLCIQLAPIFCCSISAPVENEKEEYVHKLFHSTCVESQRLLFFFRDTIIHLRRVHDYSTLSARYAMYLDCSLAMILPMHIGVNFKSDNDEADNDAAEIHCQKMCSLLHVDVLRQLYLLRNVIIEKGGGEKAAIQSVASIELLTRVLTRIATYSVGCTLNKSTLEELYLQQITSIFELDNWRILYLYRDAVAKKGFADGGGTRAIASLYAVRDHISRERAALIFQSFIYVLKHFVATDESDVKHGGWGGEFRRSHHSSLLVAILDGLATLVRTYRITWRESVESLCLLTLAQQLLDSPTLSAKVGLVVQALRLIQLCIENFMPPNLALLTNPLTGTSFDQLGPLIFRRLHDSHWEVRDSSLEVLHTIATISQHKYPFFQDLILDNKLCGMVVHLALNDAESYVCASATKCLAAMVCVDRLWNEELKDKDLVNKMIGVLSGESEGVLRREASLLMSQIFKHRKVMEDDLQKICITMSHVVVFDLHWEVKVNALNFWELIIEQSMNNQGMIDGEFPSVTFSKEHRKIVNLTPNAIRERLKKVLDELSRNGCLHVLLAAIHSEEDLEVVKKASEIIKSLSSVLEQHRLLNLKKSTFSSSVSLSSASSSRETSISDMSSSHETNCISPFSKSSSENNELGDFNNEVCDIALEDNYMRNGVISYECNDSQTEFSESFQSDDKLKTNSHVSILDLDPQTLGFAALEGGKPDVVPHTSPTFQDTVIDAILNDRDINLLASVYLGTEAEMPGRQGPETKISKTIRPLVVMSPAAFLKQLEVLEVDKIVTERTRWIEDTGNHLSTLLDDMLIQRTVGLDENDECNAMDCY